MHGQTSIKIGNVSSGCVRGS